MSFIQASAVVESTGTPPSVALSLTGVVASSDILVAICQTGSGTGDTAYSVSSNVDGAFTLVVENDAGGTRAAEIWRLKSATAGSHTITVSADAGSALFRAVAIERSGLDQSASPGTSSITEGADTNSHVSASGSGLTTTASAFVLCATAYASAGVSTTTAGSGYTEIDMGGVQWFVQYKDAATAITNDTGAWTSTGTARKGCSVMATFLDTAAPAAPSVYPRMTQRAIAGWSL